MFMCVCVLCVCNRPDSCAQRRTIWFVLTLGKHDEEEEVVEGEDEDERRTRRRTRRTQGEISTSSAGSAVATLESVHSINTGWNKRKDVRIFLYEVCYSRSTTATTQRSRKLCHHRSIHPGFVGQELRERPEPPNLRVPFPINSLSRARKRLSFSFSHTLSHGLGA